LRLLLESEVQLTNETLKIFHPMKNHDSAVFGSLKSWQMHNHS